MGSGVAASGVLTLALWGGMALADCAPDRVEVQLAPDRSASFAVEIADTDALREKGLMDRPALAPDRGMLFVYPAPRHVFYWMKDTLIPLDLLFVDETGRVTRVKAAARPLDETPIDGGAGVRYVLEINGGLAGTLGIVPGARLRAAAMEGQWLDWPCP